jgi:3-deoxy-D-manno-octulosonate 8-phosphate phosphatase (KDO 8-P phosphatase)
LSEAVLTEAEFSRRATALEWVLMDVDGVLTDGRLYYSRSGETLKAFHVRDGMGMRLAQRDGLKLGVISSRAAAPLIRRAEDLRLNAVLTGREAKGPAFDEFLDRFHTKPQNVAFIGDDLQDLIVLARAGLAFAPADAVPEVRAVAHHVLANGGGHGAVREMIELILRARGSWDRLLASFTFAGE